MFRKHSPVSFSFVAIIAATSFVFSSCGGNKEEEGNTEYKDVEQTTDTISSQVRVDFDLIRVNIPQPMELTKKLNAAKIPYNKSILLSSGKTGSFSSNYSKAIGMGAFGADLGIAAAYNNSQDALE